MGALDEAAFDALVSAGCAACGNKTLTLRAYLDALIPLQASEPVGKITWVYDGEKFVDGVFEIACAGCKATLFASAMCPRCNAADGLARALSSENDWPVPSACPRCENEEVRYLAFVPARVTYEGKRADKARSSTDAHDPGFHGWRVDCRACGTVAERVDACPLCHAPAPLRARP